MPNYMRIRVPGGWASRNTRESQPTGPRYWGRKKACASGFTAYQLCLCSHGIA